MWRDAEAVGSFKRGGMEGGKSGGIVREFVQEENRVSHEFVSEDRGANLKCCGEG